MTRDSARNSVEDVVAAAEEEARRAEAEAERIARGVGDDTVRTLRDGARAAREDVNARVDSAFDAAAAEAARASAASAQAADDRGADDIAGHAFESVSAFLEDTADGLRRRDLGAVAEDVRRVAHRNPLTFAAGAAVVGFAAARFLQASASKDDAGTATGPERESDPWADP